MKRRSIYHDQEEKKDEPLISVIIPIHNAEEYLDRCLQSVRDQSYLSIEILLIDDGSEDNSRNICQNYAETDNRFHLYVQNNKGVSEARNLGLEKANGIYILFTDSDDCLEKEYVWTLWTSMEMTGADMVVCDYRQECEQTEEKDMDHFSAHPGSYTRKAYINEISRCPGAHYFGVVWNKIYKTELVKSSRMRFRPELSLGEDFVFNMEYVSLANRIDVIGDRLYIYSWKNQNSLSRHKKTPEKQIEERIALYRAYTDLFRREHLERCWVHKLHFYILKAYFEETKWMRKNTEEQQLFYQIYIRGTGIGRMEFRFFCLLRSLKHLLGNSESSEAAKG